jgi:hemoglobin
VKADIRQRADIESLVDTFYAQVRQDPLIGPIFNEHIGDDWSAHIPKIHTFWEAVLLGSTGYSGNIIQQHLALNRRYDLSEEKFSRWLSLWQSTIDALFAGAKAEEAKSKAGLMAQLMRMKFGSLG